MPCSIRASKTASAVPRCDAYSESIAKAGPDEPASLTSTRWRVYAERRTDGILPAVRRSMHSYAAGGEPIACLKAQLNAASES
jgi:hypothetical protein